MRHLALMLALTSMNAGLDSDESTHKSEEEPPPFKFKTCFIIRGLSGSGKSAVAEGLVGGSARRESIKVPDPSFEGPDENYRFTVCKHGVVCSTDSYFFDAWHDDGIYDFDPAKLGPNHQLNQNAVSFAMSKGIPGIVVDNTNTQNWEMAKYVQMARHYGYKIVVVEVPHVSVDICDQRNSHGVPRDTLEKMAKNLESNRYNLGGSDGGKLR